MKFTTNIKNIKFGTPPDGVIVKIYIWVKNSKGLNWAIYSEIKED
jgi:hypothetical protein